MKVTEKNFVEELKRKNEKALEYVIMQYGWIIKSIVRKQLYHLESHEEECINDILMGIWNNINQFDPSRNHFGNWVAGICKYKTFDYMRKYLRDLDCIGLDEVDERIGQEEKYVVEEEIDCNYILEHLNETDKDLFKRLYIEEETVKEVAASMGMKTDVIYNRVSRGKRRIREIFQGMGR